MQISDGEILKQRLRAQMMVHHFKVKDNRIINFVQNKIIDQNFFMDDFMNSALELLDIEYEEMMVDGDVHDELTMGYEYYIHGIFRVPGLLPYLDHPLFNTFLDHIEIRLRNDYSSTIELAYVPHTDLLGEDNEKYKEFIDQPATFMLGGTGGGDSDTKLVYSFLVLFLHFNDALRALIEGREFINDNN